MAMANAQRDAGDLTGAVATYQRSIALDARAPLAWVNLGIALTHLGDHPGAATALVRAASIDAAEPLAWYNLANLSFARAEYAAAVPLYERAIALDGALVEAHFQLARAALLQARPDSARALRHLRRGLAFDSSNAAAVAQAAVLAIPTRRRSQ